MRGSHSLHVSVSGALGFRLWEVCCGIVVDMCAPPCANVDRQLQMGRAGGTFTCRGQVKGAVQSPGASACTVSS